MTGVQIPTSAQDSGTYVSSMEIRVLGPVEVLVGPESVPLGGQKQRALLAMLVASAPNVVSVDRLVEGIWAEDPSPGVRSTLQTYASNLRHAVGDVIVHDRGGYRLDVDTQSIDAVRFVAVLDEARTGMTTAPEQTAARLREVLGWWRGRPYADLVDVSGLGAEIRRLEELRLEAVEVRFDAELATGHHDRLVAELEALAEEHPTRERFRAQHMLALYRSGRQGEALRAYRRTESFLSEELGIEPSEELQDLELAILQHDDSLVGGAGRAVTQRLAFLVSDIEGSTRAWDRHPRAMVDALATHDRAMAQAVEEAGGRLFKHTGDGVLAAFPEAIPAVEAAEAAQRALADAEWGEVGELRVRIGLDVGEAESRGGDFFGPPLNRAARLCAVGHGGQVLVSASVQDEVVKSGRAGVQIRQLGEHLLRGMAAPERIAQLVFVGLPAEFPDLRTDAESTLDQRAEMVSLPGYEVRDRIGEGAFGVVWRAYQPSVGREVAVKVIRSELASQPSFVRGFEAEARTIARLAHPHIVPTIDFWRDTDSAYLVLGLLAGGSLAAATEEGTVDRAAARRILGQVGSALDHAHSQEMAHGDLKPANVLLDGAGNAYLSDFGIAARLLSPEVVASVSTDPGYRAPEAAVSGPSPAADIYALGVLAGELLAGIDDIDPVIARATAPFPEDRHASAAELLADLDEVLGTELPETPRPVVSRNPFKGLRAFEEGDAADLYGRDELIATLVAAVSEHRFVTVVGPSGSGKSSVVGAGLLPALAAGALDGSDAWFRVACTPGPDPVRALTQALEGIATRPLDPDQLAYSAWSGAVDGEVLVVVDQFEEIYTLADPDRRNRFLDLLADAVEDEASGVRVVATLRADFYDRPLEHERIGRLVRDGLVTVLRPTREELLAMITAPAQAVGLRWQSGLPHRIVEDVSHQPGGLPLLQFALTEMVERRSSNLLTDADYTTVGGVGGALATRAESLYQVLTPNQQEAARQILLRLVTVDEDTDDTRRRVRRTELESVGIPRPVLDAVLDLFILERLLLADRDPATHGPTVEVAHEALLREWPRLAGWVDDQREALILGRRFRAALAEWEDSHRHADHLLTGSRLAPFVGWADTTTLTPDERDYYQASQARDQEERTARRRRRRTLASILAAATILATGFGIVAAVQAERATSQALTALLAEKRAEEQAEAAIVAAARAEEEADNARLAEERALVEALRARSSELSAFATAVLSSDPALAKLLALTSAMTFEPSLDTLSVIHQAFAADPVIDRYLWPEGRDVGFMWTSVSPDGTQLVAAGCGCALPSTYLEVYDPENDEVLWSYEVQDERIIVDSPRYSPDGESVVVGLYWLEETLPEAGPLGALVFDATGGDVLHHLDLGQCGGTVFGVSATHIVSDAILDGDECFHQTMSPPALLLTELDSGAQRVLTTLGSFAIMSGDGRYVVYDDLSANVFVVEDVLTGGRITEIEIAPFLGHNPAAFNHDGSLLVLARGSELDVWDIAAGEMLGSFDGHPAGVHSATFSTAGDDTVYSTGRAGALLHWDARTTSEIASFPAVGNGNVSMSETGMVWVADQTARTSVSIATGTRGEVWAVDGGWCGGFALSTTTGVGGGLASFTEHCPDRGDFHTAVIDLNAGELVTLVPGGQWQASLIAPDGSRFARQDIGDRPVEFGPIKVRDTTTGDVVTQLAGICTWDGSITPFGGAGQDGCFEYPETPFPMFSRELFWAPDGRRVAVWNDLAGLFVVWDADSGALVSGYDGCDEPRGGLFDGEAWTVYCTEQLDARMIRVDAATGDEISSVAVERLGTDLLGFVGYTPGGEFLVAVRGHLGTGGGALVWFDAETLEIAHVLERIHEGSPKSSAQSPSGTLVATGSSDGFVKVWDVDRRIQVHEIQIRDTEIQGLAFVNETHLAVVTRQGLFHVYTLDVDELQEIVAGSLTRGFTTTECERYGFGAECPTLEELQGSRLLALDR